MFSSMLYDTDCFLFNLNYNLNYNWNNNLIYLQYLNLKIIKTFKIIEKVNVGKQNHYFTMEVANLDHTCIVPKNLQYTGFILKKYPGFYSQNQVIFQNFFFHRYLV